MRWVVKGRYRKNAMTMWILRCYDPNGSGGGIHAWYDALEKDVQAEVDTALELLPLERGPLTDAKHYSEMRNKCEGLDKIVIEVPVPDTPRAKPRQFRILCFRGPGKRECTLLFGFEKETTADYGPACGTAHRRKEGVNKDVHRGPPCRFP